MLKKQRRMTSADFLQFRRSRAIKGKYLTLTLGVPSQDPIRVGVVVSKKVAKRAVVRNRIKRRVIEACSRVLPVHYQGLLLIHPSGACATTEFGLLVEDIRSVSTQLYAHTTQ